MNKKGEKLKNYYKELNRSMVKKNILSIVDPSEMTKTINYSPSYQRNYIWKDKKAIKLIETILLNREVPPLTVIEKGDSIEIIDGRQRYESILRFFNDEFCLQSSGLSVLKPLDKLKYSELPLNIKSIFDEYKLKFITYKIENSSKLSESEIDQIKRDLFRRYNYGMTPLNKIEVARAKYLYDDLTKLLRDEFLKNDDEFNSYVNIYLPLSRRNLNNRDKLNHLLVTAREVISSPYIPIIGIKNVKLGTINIEQYYEYFVKKENVYDKRDEFFKISQKLIEIKMKLEYNKNNLYDNNLFFKSVYWMFSILYKVYPSMFYDFNINQFCHYLESEMNAEEYYSHYKNLSSDHIINRHLYVKNYLTNFLNLDLESFFNRLLDNRRTIIYKSPEKLKGADNWLGIKNNKQIITIPETFSVREIIKLQRDNRFIVRPIYQRSEVRSIEKASKIIESIILGIKLPPIYVILSINNVGLKEYTVIDGQQRLISILTFLGEQVLDENYDFIKTYKKNYKLVGLKDLEYLCGKSYNGDNSISSEDKSLILNYEIEVILIEEKDNNLDPVDMFLRLNENPNAISKNSFEMWNSFEITNIIDKIKKISKYVLFQQKSGNIMKEEELVTILAFMSKEKINFDNCNKFFNINLRIANKNKANTRVEVNMSVMNKEKITHYLEYLEPDTDEEKLFFGCLKSVEIFIEKLDILFKDDYSQLIQILNPYISNPRKGSMKDFYLMWLILDQLDKHILTTYKLNILSSLSEIYRLMKNMPSQKDLDYFFDYTKSMVKKFKK